MVNETPKPGAAILEQPTVVAEWSGEDWLVCLSDGECAVFANAQAVLKRVLRDAKHQARSGEVLITKIEWHGVPPGFVPPQGNPS
jgi:hypothetical protein